VRNVHYIVADGSVVAQVTHVQDTPDGPVTDRELRYLLTDGQGSVVQTTDSTGAVMEEFYYDPFGRPTNASHRIPLDEQGSGVRLGYTGREHDHELALTNMRGRIYDPIARRFLTPDPFVSPLFSQSYNRYSYVWNNPATLIDPTGFLPSRSLPPCPKNFPDCGEETAANEGTGGAPVDESTASKWADITEGVNGIDVDWGDDYPDPAGPRPGDGTGVGGGTGTGGEPGGGSQGGNGGSGGGGKGGGTGKGSEGGPAGGGSVGAIDPTLFAQPELCGPACDMGWRPDPCDGTTFCHWVGGGFLAGGVAMLAVLAAPEALATLLSHLGLSGETATVWASVRATQAFYQGTVIPRSFEIATASGAVWVHGNATEHMAERAVAMLNRGIPQALVNLGSQVQIRSLQSAVQLAIDGGIRYGELMRKGGWELIFRAPRAAGQLPALIHALQR
jgi:RHS repeat-associated protein